jgi:hypothetical protein
MIPLRRIGFGVSNGTLTFNGNGTFSNVHNGSETTSDSFTYKANDGTTDSNTVSVTITVSPVNDAQLRLPIKLWLPKVELLPFLVGDASSVLANDTDVKIPLPPCWFPG